MALEYKLALQEPEDETPVVDLLLHRAGLVRAGDKLKGTDLLAAVRKPNDLTVEVIRDEFGFVPRVQAWFRLDKFGDVDAAVALIIRASLDLLQLGEGDAVLLFNGEAVVLQRKAGRLLLNSGSGFWRPERLALVSLPYELANIPSI